MNEEEKTQEIQEETSGQPKEETASVIEQATKAAERIEKATKEMNEGLNRLDEMRGNEMLSGKSNAGKGSQIKEVDEEAEFEKEIKASF